MITNILPLTVCDTLCDSYAMQRNETLESNESHAPRFVPVLDGSKRKIKGLWQRGEKYDAQMRIASPNGKTRPVRIPLDATTLKDAKEQLESKAYGEPQGQVAHSWSSSKIRSVSLRL